MVKIEAWRGVGWRGRGYFIYYKFKIESEEKLIKIC